MKFNTWNDGRAFIVSSELELGQRGGIRVSLSTDDGGRPHVAISMDYDNAPLVVSVDGDVMVNRP